MVLDERGPRPPTGNREAMASMLRFCILICTPDEGDDERLDCVEELRCVVSTGAPRLQLLGPREKCMTPPRIFPFM